MVCYNYGVIEFFENYGSGNEASVLDARKLVSKVLVSFRDETAPFGKGYKSL
jgi:hypothetical protein